MTYDKPEIRDFGSIADHTYTEKIGDNWDCVSAVKLWDDETVDG
jgi:hypothetical protein